MKSIKRPFALLAAAAAAAAVVVLPAAASAATPPDASSHAVTPHTADIECLGIVILPVEVPLPARTNNGSSDCFLVQGDHTPAVGVLQTALKLCNLHANIAVDDDFGPATKAALVAFQNAHGLTPDGGYGNQTRGALLWPDNISAKCTRPTHF